MLRQVLSAGRVCALVCTMVLTGAGFTPQAWAQTRSTSAPPPAAASAASAPLQGAIAGTVFEVIATTPVDLGAPDSPRASLAHFFEAVRTGRWTDASRHLVLDKVQQPRGAELARRLRLHPGPWPCQEVRRKRPRGNAALAAMPRQGPRSARGAPVAVGSPVA